MNDPTFNVLDEPWIPVIRADGSSDELGIRQCLEQAHELREIRDPSPIIEFGLYRLLVAFILDALILANERPEHWSDLKELIKAGRFDLEMFEAYVHECGDVFDLFHPERPFLQTVVKQEKSKPLAAMYPAVASGTNASLWHHDQENRMTVGVPEAARLLSSIPPFMTSGGSGLGPSINGAPAIYALPVGNNLFETLVLNIPLRNQDTGQGSVAWRNTRKPGGDRTQATTVESLTWRPRCIQLIPDVSQSGEVLVTEMKFEKGDITRLEWSDASLAYRYDKDKVTPIHMREGRPIWRDAGPLLLLNESEHGREDRKVSFKRPDVIEQALDVIEPDTALSIQVYGMRTEKKKVFEWAKAGLSIPVRLGRSTRLGSIVSQDLDLAEKSAYALRTCIKALYPREGAGNKKALGQVVNRCERAYWLQLWPNFNPLMNAFAALDESAAEDVDLITSTAKEWREAIRRLATDEFENAAKDMDADSDALMRQVQARTRLHNTIRKVFE